MESLADNTRRRNRVGTGLEPLLFMYFSSVLGTTTVSDLVVDTSAFTNRALPLSRRKLVHRGQRQSQIPGLNTLSQNGRPFF